MFIHSTLGPVVSIAAAAVPSEFTDLKSALIAIGAGVSVGILREVRDWIRDRRKKRSPRRMRKAQPAPQNSPHGLN